MIYSQGFTLRVVDVIQLYPLLYTFHNNLTVGYILAKKILKKLRLY